MSRHRRGRAEQGPDQPAGRPGWAAIPAHTGRLPLRGIAAGGGHARTSLCAGTASGTFGHAGVMAEVGEPIGLAWARRRA